MLNLILQLLMFGSLQTILSYEEILFNARSILINDDIIIITIIIIIIILSIPLTASL